MSEKLPWFMRLTLDQLLEILSRRVGFVEPSGPGGSGGSMTLSSL